MILSARSSALTQYVSSVGTLLFLVAAISFSSCTPPSSTPVVLGSSPGGIHGSFGMGVILVHSHKVGTPCHVRAKCREHVVLASTVVIRPAVLLRAPKCNPDSDGSITRDAPRPGVEPWKQVPDVPMNHSPEFFWGNTEEIVINCKVG